MLNNYFKIALRNFKKGYTYINVFGLAVGLATGLLIALFVLDELSYDRHHEKADRIVRVAVEARLGGQDYRIAVTPAPLGETLVEQFSEVQAAARLETNASGILVQHGEEQFLEEHLAFADASVFDVFTIPLLRGEAQTALAEPNSAVLSASTARKYFGESDPIGQVLAFNGVDYRVTGVMEDMPPTGHFRFDILRSLATLESSRNPSWLASNFYTYLLLGSPDAAEALAAKLPALVANYVGPQLQEVLGMSLDEMRASGGGYAFTLQPLTDIHLHSHLDAEIGQNAEVRYVYILSFIAVFILLIACINFMNLATARSAERAREVGMRKVVGAHRRQLVGQFLSESVMLAVLGLGLALGLVELALPFFNGLAGKELAIPYVQSGWVLPGLAVLVLVVGLLAGSYPALFLASFKPIAALKGGRSASARNGAALRRGLVVFQFALSMLLISGTVVVYQQVGYMQTKNLGFDKEHVVAIERAWALDGQAEVFRQTLAGLPGVTQASVSSNLPGRPTDNTTFQVEGAPPDELYPMRYIAVDYTFPETLELALATGRFFSPEVSTDSSAIILNEAAVQRLGWETPLGHRLVFIAPDPQDNQAYTVVGVVKDFHFESLRQEIQPMALMLDPPFDAGASFVAARVRPDDLPVTLGALEATWQRFAPGQPFQFSFLDKNVDALYEAEQRLGTLFGYFAGLAILIACLGLFGLAAFMAEKRTKEIGIRKVLGASVPGLIGLLSKEFVRLVAIAFVIVVPVAYLVMNRWLEGFAYRVDISWRIFLITGLAALGAALLTVSYQAIKAALADPVKSLRYE